MFQGYVRGYLGRHFHGVRLSKGGPAPAVPDGLLIVVLNHPSWWDPLVGLVLAGAWPDRAHFAPIEARALGRYRFFERLGFFGIEPGTTRGALALIRTGLALADQPGATLWITAQGRFADPRLRPAGLQAGVGHLVHRLGSGTVLPLALEYPFWDESRPEALARFGTPMPIGGGGSPGSWTGRIERALEETQDALATEAQARAPGAFDLLISGRAGVGGVYDAWRRLGAALRGERFTATHGEP